MRISDWSSDVCSSDLIVGGLQPDFAAVAVAAFIGARVERAGTEFLPEIGIILRLGMVGRAAYPVVLAGDLFQAIAHQAQEICVGSKDRAVQPEFDPRLVAVEGNRKHQGLNSSTTCAIRIPSYA